MNWEKRIRTLELRLHGDDDAIATEVELHQAFLARFPEKFALMAEQDFDMRRTMAANPPRNIDRIIRRVERSLVKYMEFRENYPLYEDDVDPPSRVETWDVGTCYSLALAGKPPSQKRRLIRPTTPNQPAPQPLRRTSPAQTASVQPRKTS